MLGTFNFEHLIVGVRLRIIWLANLRDRPDLISAEHSWAYHAGGPRDSRAADGRRGHVQPVRWAGQKK